MTTLREIIDNASDVSQLPFLAEYKRLYEQNDKLHELVRDMFGWYIKSECSNCEYRLDCHKLDGACDYMRKFVPSMVELGIEVES